MDELKQYLILQQRMYPNIYLDDYDKLNVQQKGALKKMVEDLALTLEKSLPGGKKVNELSKGEFNIYKQLLNERKIEAQKELNQMLSKEAVEKREQERERSGKNQLIDNLMRGQYIDDKAKKLINKYARKYTPFESPRQHDKDQEMTPDY